MLMHGLLLAFSCFAAFGFGATLLPDEEVDALRQIGQTLGKNWKFSADPCSGESGWVGPTPTLGFVNAVTCNCSYQNNTVCHIVSIVLTGQNLQGVLPPELVSLPYLQEIDLRRNYLNGTIPKEWGSMQLVKISLLGNRLSGPIPKEIGNISTLKELRLIANQFSGTLPPELGNLVNIEQLLVSSNEFSGELPTSLGNLKSLKDFRISSNRFTGKIPDFIQNWTQLEELQIQGSGLQGPIPSGISLLKNLTELILRNCNLTGPIPEYIWAMAKLGTLDLSFNKLVGQFPPTFNKPNITTFIYLTSNLLSGTVPDWLLKNGAYIDLSYNNFTLGSSGQCQQGSLNLFGNPPAANNISGDVPCLKKFQCPKSLSSLHINCGGEKVTINGVHGSTTFSEDQDLGGASKFFLSTENWAFSSTGDFLINSRETDNYIASNISRLLMPDFSLYTRARLSPLSLTYYGLCLLNGNYTVKLHFAEIMFTEDKTYSSLGKRIFDVYIQGKLVLKDFNIEDEAGGTHRAVVKNFTAIVATNTLEIRFYWAGKGTQSIPYRGTYGPLISAISVDSDFIPPTEGGKRISAGLVIGIVASAFCVIFFILGIFFWKSRLSKKPTMYEDLRYLDLQTGSFTLRQIKAATNNFDAANKIGEGGFGPVYKGLLSDGTIIAVKQLSSKSKQGNREFVNEIGIISALQHPNLVKLYGCCIEGNQLLLVYQYMENNSLARALFGPEEQQLKLDWPTRQRICVGIARGLSYLHEESRLKIVHRDIKATNILLDKDLNPKISDFGLAKLDEEEKTHISTRIAGTLGYMAPEYAMRGYLTDKADVYSFGIVALEIVSGKSITNYRPKPDCIYLLDWAYVLQERGSLIKLVDPSLGSDFNKAEAMRMLTVALLCTNASWTLRPTMSAVVGMLEGRTVVKNLISDPNISSDDLNLKAMGDHHHQIHSQEQSHHHQIHSQGQSHHHQIHSQEQSQSQSISIDEPQIGLSTYASDLYPIIMDSDYWNARGKNN